MTDSTPHSPQTFAERAGIGIAIAGMTARLLVPTESAAMGETLWISVILLIAATLYSIGRWQAGHRFQPDAFTIAIGLIVLGHLVSGLWVLGTEGHKRWAINVMWEWVSLGATCFVLRANRSALYVIAAMIVVLSGHGIWQYFVDFPALRAEYAGHVSGAGSDIEQIRAQRELDLQGISGSESTRKLFADRLASLEPLGPFALANTLGGFLALGTLFGLITLLGSQRSLGQYAVGVLLLAPIGYCLLLTKSRTAVAAVVAGLTLFGILRVLRRTPAAEDQVEESTKGEANKRSRRVFVFALAGLAIAAVAGAVATGGLDQKVVSEATKSLGYRLAYWKGTAAALRESPWFGTGPGNFRQNYTPHKLPESSEEILDPHNMFLDAWCNGGVVAMFGLLLLVIIVLRAAAARSSSGQDEPVDDSVGLKAGCCGFAIVLAQQWLTGQERVMLTVSLAGGFVLAWFAVRYAFRVTTRTTTIAFAVAAITLMIHLLGAGGFEMPAVMQVLFLFVGAAVGVPAARTTKSGWVHLTLVPICVAAVVACLLTAAIPVQRVAFLLQRGDSRTGTAALKDFSDAEQIDKFSPDPPRRFAHAMLERNGGTSSNLTLAALNRARKRDPRSFVDHFTLGMTLRQSWLSSKEPGELQSAIRHIRTAVGRYPTHPRLVGELAIALDDANESQAAANATRALQLDDINRQNGHQDRYLPADFLNQLKSIAQRTKENRVSPSDSRQ